MLPGSGRLFEANHWLWDCEQWNQMGFSDCEGQNWEYEQRKICPYCYFHLTSLNTQWGSQGASGLVVGLRHPYRAWKHFEGDFSYTDTPGWLWWFRMFYRIKLSQNLNLKHPRISKICENWCLCTLFYLKHSFWKTLYIWTLLNQLNRSCNFPSSSSPLCPLAIFFRGWRRRCSIVDVHCLLYCFTAAAVTASYCKQIHEGNVYSSASVHIAFLPRARNNLGNVYSSPSIHIHYVYSSPSVHIVCVFKLYSCPSLVVAYTEELISRTFLDENRFR